MESESIHLDEGDIHGALYGSETATTVALIWQKNVFQIHGVDASGGQKLVRRI
jgi:hypothetical protein